MHYHPELEGSARWLPRGVGTPVLSVLLRLLFRLIPTGEAEEVALNGCSAFVYRPLEPPVAPGPALLWIHGGGMIMGDARQDASFLQRIARELCIFAVSAQYRLASQLSFPTPLEDCVQAFDWLAAQPDIDPAKIIVVSILSPFLPS